MNKKLKAHIKIDTGMNRIGLNYKEAPEFIRKVLACKEMQLCGIFSHLACSEDEEITKMQAERFNFVREQFPEVTSHLLKTNISARARP